MRKFGTLLLGLAVTIGLANYHRDIFWHSAVSFAGTQSVIAQIAPEEFSLEPMDVTRLDAILQEQVAGEITSQPGQGPKIYWNHCFHQRNLHYCGSRSQCQPNANFLSCDEC